MITSENTVPPAFSKMGQGGIVIGIIGLIGLLIGLAAHMSQKTLLQSYIYGWTFGMLFALGCYGFMLFYYMVQGSWGKPTIRLFEAGAKTLPIMGLLFIPILFGHQSLYPWANHDLVYGNPALGMKPDEVLLHKAGYMNIFWFTFRTIVYFAIWCGFTFYLTDLSKRQDRTHDPYLALIRQRMAAAGFLIYVVTITLAFTDWLMSLDKHWFSTIYGFWFMIFQGLAAMSLVAFTVCRLKIARVEPYATEVNPGVSRDLGNLLLMLTMFWAYFSVSQWIIIWSGNLPDEITFYLRRNAGGFLLVGAADIIFCFFVPFLALINGYHRRTPQTLSVIAVLILIMRVIDLFWVVIPATRHPIVPVGTDLAALLFAFGIFLFAFSRTLMQAQLIPEHDAPLVQEVLSHG